MADANTRDTGTRLVAGRYRLIEPLGRGGMGTVWLALDETLRREVAVKELNASQELGGHEREVYTVRTLREARAAGRLSHPAVAAVYDVFEESGHPWIVMELVRSRTLGEVVREEGPLPPRRVAEIGLEVLSALTAAHGAGVLHRDVKPDNVLLADDGRTVLTDFGIAALEGDSPVTRTGALVGTPAFIAPERATGGGAQRASDLWSLGVTLFAAVEGRSPFQRGHALASLAAVMYEGPGPLRRAGALGPVLNGLLRKDPARRMTAAEAERSLRAITDGTAPEPTEEVPLAVPRRRRRLWPVAVAAGTLLVGLTAGGIAYVTAGGDPARDRPTPATTVETTPAATLPAEEPSIRQDDPAPVKTRKPPKDKTKKPDPSKPPPEEPTEEPTDEPSEDSSGGVVEPGSDRLQAGLVAPEP
ncbi:MAG TPA: serine/threonine-protein kinase [Trebonia sp.]